MVFKRPAPNSSRSVGNQAQSYSRFLRKHINSEKDVVQFKNNSPSYKNILVYVNLLADKILGTQTNHLKRNHDIKGEMFVKCSQLLDDLSQLCDKTDLSQAKHQAPLRFGHIAYRDWFDGMQMKCKDLIYEHLKVGTHEQLAEELLHYLSHSFGNRTRIDYGTGHELSFIIFTMGLSCLSGLPTDSGGDNQESETEAKVNVVSQDGLKKFVDQFGWDILWIFSFKYLKLCRKIQDTFRLEPAGSCGVYNMDDFQYLPFLFGAAQIVGLPRIGTKNFYNRDNVEMLRADYIFFDALDFIYQNKTGPFQEHSYTLWCLADLGSWENIYRRIKSKFPDDVLSPFPIIQHLMFGEYILRWEPTVVEANVV